jgi:predicted O-linked N-acetylglucosamine transferase (SPINDLY family)
MERFEEAIEKLRRTISLAPTFADAYFHLGGVLHECKRYEEALVVLQTALDIDPVYTVAAVKLAATYKAMGLLDDALATVRQAIVMAPEHAEAHGVLGDILQSMGMLAEAEISYREALRHDSEMVMAYCNLGIALHKLHRGEEAIACFQNALDIDPNHVNVLSHLAHATKDNKQFEQAIAYVQQALAIEPGFDGGHSLLADIQLAYGKLEQARDNYRKELELHPESLEARSAYLFMLNFLSDVPASTALAEAKIFGRLATQRVNKFRHWQSTFDTTRPLRIGLVSGDFREHPVGFFLDSTLHALTGKTTSRLHFTAYSNHFAVDRTTKRIRACCDSWCDAHLLNDEQLATRIHDDAIDILIDISGHTAHSRLPVFAWKPAPVQASWLGYFATTGMPTIDYFIADPWSIPQDSENLFTETIWRLPETRFSFTAPNSEIEVSALPALKNGFITFGCFNNLSKMTDPVVALWAKIMRETPNSRLFLKSKQLNDEKVRKDVVAQFTAHGIAAQRLQMEGYSTRTEYLAAYHRVDIALDPFPYTGGATTAESLWMGVPVFTLTGERLISRQGTSLLMNAGLSDWTATTEQAYFEGVVKHTRDIDALAALRMRLRNQVLASPLFDAPRFATHFESALYGMWAIYCAQNASQTDVRT